MRFNILRHFLTLFKPSEPDPKFIASQLRKPSGEYAKEVGDNMDKVNEALYDLTLEVMEPQTGNRILEIGFGTGKFFDKLITSKRNLYVSGIDDFFDKIYCNMVIYFWDQPKKHLKEIRRVLKPGGKFYTGIRSHKSTTSFPFVKYGFNLYKRVEWKNILKQNDFFPLETRKQLDSPIEFNGNQLQLDSYCIAASKENGLG